MMNVSDHSTSCYPIWFPLHFWYSVRFLFSFLGSFHVPDQISIKCSFSDIEFSLFMLTKCHPTVLNFHPKISKTCSHFTLPVLAGEWAKQHLLLRICQNYPGKMGKRIRPKPAKQNYLTRTVELLPPDYRGMLQNVACIIGNLTNTKYWATCILHASRSPISYLTMSRHSE